MESRVFVSSVQVSVEEDEEVQEWMVVMFAQQCGRT